MVAVGVFSELGYRPGQILGAGRGFPPRGQVQTISTSGLRTSFPLGYRYWDKASGKRRDAGEDRRHVVLTPNAFCV